MDLERLVWDILTAPAKLQPHDGEACLECQYHPTNLKFEPVPGGQYCYMLREEPETLCMQFRKINIVRA